MGGRLPGLSAGLVLVNAGRKDDQWTAPPAADSGSLSLAERWRRSQLEATRARVDIMNETRKPEGTATPGRCPVCRSEDVTTTSKVVSAESYWRCCGCGEVWNAGRHRTASRRSHDRPFGR